jgi:hypothetical protein
MADCSCDLSGLIKLSTAVSDKHYGIISRTHFRPKLRVRLIEREIYNRSMASNVKDRIVVRDLDIGQFLRTAEQCLYFLISEELDAFFVRVYLNRSHDPLTSIDSKHNRP